MNTPPSPASPAFTGRGYDFVAALPAQNLIGGRFQAPSQPSGELPILNPRHGREMSRVLLSGAADVDAAVKAARAAAPAWAELPIRERALFFYRLRQLLVRDFEELAWLISHENGKVIDQARAEVEKAIECVEFGCSLPNLAAGTQLEVSRGVTCELTYAPLGVVAGITPFNFPLMVPLWMIPQAIVGGNAFILKPSEQTPLSAMLLGRLFAEAGLPDGIYNIVQGGRETVEALCDHPGIAAVGFVGSTKVAKLVYGRACAAGKRALCLGGAKNHLIVVPDADPDVTVDNIVASFTGCAGQRCMAAANLVAVGEVDDIIEAVCQKAAALSATEGVGPLTTDASRQRILSIIAQAEADGARVRVDGRGAASGEGFYLGATVLDGVDPGSRAAQEEIFGPVLSIIRVKTLEEAIKIENDNPYGNASTVYTTSGDVARLVMGRVQAGMCGVNVGVPVPREPFGFGGWNDSKFGTCDITGKSSIEFWTQLKKTTTKWNPEGKVNWMS